MPIYIYKLKAFLPKISLFLVLPPIVCRYYPYSLLMSQPIPTSSKNNKPSQTQFGRSPRRDYISFGSVGKPGVFLGGSLPRRTSYDLSTEERRHLLDEEQELLADNHIKTPQRPAPRRNSSSGNAAGRAATIATTYGSILRESEPLLEELEEENTEAANESTPLVSNIKAIEEEEDEIIKAAWDDAIANGNIQTSYRREYVVLLRNTFPVSMAFLLQYSLTVVSIFCVGHLGKNELSAVSLAAMIANISGYGIVQGIATCLDTLAAQSFGRGDNEMVGIYTQRCFILMCLTLTPIVLIWVNAKPFLLAIVPEVECCELASQYLKILSTGIPPYVIFELSKHYLQAQGIFHANTYVLIFCAPLNVILNYVLVWDKNIGIGFIGAPIAVVLTDYLMAILSVCYVIYIEGHQCWHGWSKEALRNWGYMSHLALSGVLTIEAEWLAFEILTFAAARLGTTELATQTVLSTMCVLCYQIPMGMGIAASTRVGNLVGAGLGQSAAIASKASIYVGAIFGTLNGLILFALRDKVGALFSNDEDVIRMTAEILPYGAMYQINDALSAVTGGLLRGQGRQNISGYVNLIFYYIFALPVGLYLCFGLDWQLAGLWIGICVALVSVSVIQIIVVIKADWEQIIQKSIEEFEHENEENNV